MYVIKALIFFNKIQTEKRQKYIWYKLTFRKANMQDLNRKKIGSVQRSASMVRSRSLLGFILISCILKFTNSLS